MWLPSMKYAERAVKRQTVEFRGINFSDNTREGEFSSCTNLSARRYPFLAQRRPRVPVADYVAPTAMTAWNKMIVVDGTSLFYDGKSVGTVSAGEKQFAVVNTKLVIWPDKKYLDMNTLKLSDMSASVSGSATFDTAKITIAGANFTSLFSVGDGVTISGCKSNTGNNKDAVIKALTDTTMTFSANSFTAGSETAVKIERRIPDMDFICESQNRLWGVSNKEKTIYASALGDPCNFFVYQGISTDGYTLAVGSAGDFTGCVSLSTGVLFWKENLLHKILGSYPAEYALSTYEITGLQAGCEKSMQIINDTLFYKAPDGVYAYSGGTPENISGVFGAKRFSDAVAGTDGVRYYISMKSSDGWHLLTYDTQKGLWMREDDTQAVDFARFNENLYLLSSDSSIWAVDAQTGMEIVEWMAEFAPFYEQTHGKKCYSSLYLRLEMEEGAWCEAQTRCDGGRWEMAGTVRGQRTAILPIRPRRCDRFEVRLSGKGACAILSMQREIRIGTEV